MPALLEKQISIFEMFFLRTGQIGRDDSAISIAIE